MYTNFISGIFHICVQGIIIKIVTILRKILVEKCRKHDGFVLGSI